MNPVVKLKQMKLVGKPVHNVELTGDQQESANPTVEQESEQLTLPGPEGDLFAQQTFSAPEGFPVQKELLNLADAMDATDAEQLARDFSDTLIDPTPSTKDNTGVFSTPKESDVLVTDVVTPDLAVIKSLPPTNPDLTLWLPPTTGGVQYTPIYPYAPQDQSNPQVSAPTQSTPSAVFLQLTTQSGQSTRWGRVLKGQHNFACVRCHRPFTTKSDTIRHNETNCPKLPENLKKKFTCADCGKNTFTSKQYLKEHIHEVHKQEFLYFCKCGKGFYKHSAANFHKKSCLTYLRS